MSDVDETGNSYFGSSEPRLGEVRCTTVQRHGKTSFNSLKVQALPLGAANFLQGSATLGFDFQVLDDCSLSNPLCWPFITDTIVGWFFW